MMREIKFRAYLDDFEEMFYRVWLFESELYVDLDGKPWDVLDLDDRVHVMQYTGLKDKNGVEIYEGDIVKGYSVYPATDAFQSFLIGEVYYTNRGTWDCYSYILGGFNEQVEVVGNIYENPELIPEVRHA